MGCEPEDFLEVLLRLDAVQRAGRDQGPVHRIPAEAVGVFEEGPVPPAKDDVAELRQLFAKEEHYFDAMSQALQKRDMKAFYGLNDHLTDVALDETDILANLGAYACDISLSSAFS